jgi:hypothetical protein
MRGGHEPLGNDVPGQKSVATTMTTPLVLGTTEEVDLITVQ